MSCNSIPLQERKEIMTYTQREIWAAVTGSDFLYEDIGLYEQCKTSRDREGDKLRQDLREKFEATLNEKQKKAFFCFMEIVDAARWGAERTCIVIGLQLAKEIRAVLDHPMETHIKVGATYRTWEASHGDDIRDLEEYFKEVV
jgi:hypothetical protein